MAYVITQNCCKDASCVPVCPVDCIRPVAAPGAITAEEMLYIDPETCIDCGACLEECPVEAIYYDQDLPEELARFRDINAQYFEAHPLEQIERDKPRDREPVDEGSMSVGIVGAGPAACYAAAALLRTPGVEVDVYDRLPTPFGLIRAGVAPDHQHTKAIVNVFGPVLADPRVRCHFNVTVGSDLTHEDLMAHHHAVIYAVGASLGRQLGIPGEESSGNYAAADFVGWYNGHPDHQHHDFDLSGPRVVIVGNGNVALDAARILVTDPRDLEKSTDISPHALEALSNSAIDEVVLLARRGPAHAAFSIGEFLALGHLPGVDVVIDGADADGEIAGDDVEARVKVELIGEFAARDVDPANKRIVFRFNTTPVEFVGSPRIEGLKVQRTEGASAGPSSVETLDTALVLRSIGYRGLPVDGLPFDEDRGVIPNRDGRIVGEDGTPVPGVYVAGWIKRGPRGVIGTNRSCAEETVDSVWSDHDNGALVRDVEPRNRIEEALETSGVAAVDWKGWRAIDAAERKAGAAASRPRLKFTDIDEMVSASRT